MIEFTESFIMMSKKGMDIDIEHRFEAIKSSTT